MSSLKKKETFFEAVGKGSVKEVEKFLNKNGKKETAALAKTINKEGETPLLLAIKGDHEDMVKFLIEKLKVSSRQLGRFSWNGVHFPHAPPLFAAVVSAKSVCLSIVDTLIYSEDKEFDFASFDPGAEDDDEIFADSIVSSSLTRQQKIDVLELLGAVYIIKTSIVKLYTAVELWKRAILLREPTDNDEPEIPKVTYSLSECAQKVFGNISEFESWEELVQMASEPTQNYLWFKYQSFLISLRIMRQIHPDPNSFSLFVLYYYGTSLYMGMGKYPEAIHTLMLVLEPYQGNEEVTYEWPYELIATSVAVISESFHKLKELPVENPNRKELTFASIMKALSYSSPYTKQPIDAHLDKKVDVTVYGIFKMTSLIAAMLPQIKQEEQEEFKKWLSGYIGFINKHPGVRSLLHFACAQTKVQVEMIQLFIEAGADPNAPDSKGDTPLQALAKNQNAQTIMDAAQSILLNAGGLIGKANASGKVL